MALDLDQAYGHCEALAREADKDRWLAGLFAPAEGRRHLMALAAFDIETAAVRERVSDPLPGEVRLQWWRDAIQGEGRGEVTANPIAAALLATIVSTNLPKKPFLDLLEARVHDLYDDLFPTICDLEGHCGETAGAIMQLSAIALMGGRDPGTGDIAGHMGVAQAVTSTVRAHGRLAARGRLAVPREVLDRHGLTREEAIGGFMTPALAAALAEMRALARGHIEAARHLVLTIPPEAVPAFLQTTVCRLALDRMDRPGWDPFQEVVEIPQWRRQWAMWRAARLARG